MHPIILTQLYLFLGSVCTHNTRVGIEEFAEFWSLANIYLAIRNSSFSDEDVIMLIPTSLCIASILSIPSVGSAIEAMADKLDSPFSEDRWSEYIAGTKVRNVQPFL